MTVLSTGPIPSVDLSAGAENARLPAAALADEEGRVTGQGTHSTFDGQASPAPRTVPEVRDLRLPLTPAERAAELAKVKPPEKLIVANAADRPRVVAARTPGQSFGASATRIGYGKEIDPREYDLGAVRRAGLKLVPAAKFDADGDFAERDAGG